MRQAMMSVVFAVGGLTLMSVSVVIPIAPGRPESVLAEVLHDSTDTTGLVHAAIDCDRVTPGTQSHCFVLATAPMLEVDVTVGNSTAGPAEITQFYFSLKANELVLDPIDEVLFPYEDTNPDFDQSIVPAGGFWTCGPPPYPDADLDADPAVALSFLSCYGLDSDVMLPTVEGHTALASVRYDVAAVGTTELRLQFMEIDDYDDHGNPPSIPVLCDDVEPDEAGMCLEATVEVVAPSDDYDGDGVANGVDNCIADVNASQLNTDRNVIVQVPTLSVNDATRANSDSRGDACDDDDDNDGLTDMEEGIGCNGGLPSSASAFDTDGDRFFDGAECARGTDPLDADSKPLAAACGTTADGDGDRLNERQEQCHYNTDPAGADSDGDGMRDGCEAGSLNNDGVVNSGDQLLFSLQHLSALAGFGALANTDVNKDGNHNSGDQLLMAFLIQPMGQCP